MRGERRVVSVADDADGTPDGSAGAEVAVRALWSMTQKLVGGEISQLIRHETSAKVVDWGADKGSLVCSDGAEIDVLRAVSGGRRPCAGGSTRCTGSPNLAGLELEMGSAADCSDLMCHYALAGSGPPMFQHTGKQGGMRGAECRARATVCRGNAY